MLKYGKLEKNSEEQNDNDTQLEKNKNVQIELLRAKMHRKLKNQERRRKDNCQSSEMHMKRKIEIKTTRIIYQGPGQKRNIVQDKK